MKVVSLGCNCYVGLFLRDHFPGEFYPFDWIWSTLGFVVETFETDRLAVMDSERKDVKIVHDTEEESIVREKYKRRFERLYATLNGTEEVVLIRKTLDRDQGAILNKMDTAEDLNRLLRSLGKFRAPITLCVIDMEKCIDRKTLHPSIRLFDSFDGVASFT